MMRWFGVFVDIVKSAEGSYPSDRVEDSCGRRGPSALDSADINGLIHGGGSDKDVYESSERNCVAAKDGGDQIEIKEAPEAPVESADDKEYCGDYIESFHCSVPFDGVVGSVMVSLFR